MMVLNTILPLFVLMLLGRFLKDIKLVSDSFFKTSDRLVYYVFFPIMMFWKLGSDASGGDMSMGLCLAALIGEIFIFCIIIGAIKPLRISKFQAGSFVQTGVRFNSYMGMAVVMNALGDEGMRHFSLLSGCVIPVINVLCVSALIYYSDLDLGRREKALYFCKALISNPLILGCLAGIGFAATGWHFPVFLKNTFAMVTAITLPMALMSIGASLRFKGIAGHLRAASWGCAYKLVVFPLAGFILLRLFQVTGSAFTTGMVFFCLPTATSTYVLSGQLHSDTDLASVSIMVSTLLSTLPLSLALVL